jgi:putative heme-binding domain-containing protein
VRFLTASHRRPAPWDGAWWGTRPSQGKPPQLVEDWEGTPLVLAAIQAALGDASPAVRLAAAEATRATRDPEALARLRDRFATEPDPEVRTAAARTFAATGERAALPVLVIALGDPRSPAALREAALEAVEILGADQAGPALSSLAARRDLPTSELPRILQALARTRHAAAAPVVLGYLDSADPAVRAAAVACLASLEPGPKTAAAVRARLGDPSLPVRKAALAAIAATRDAEALSAVIEAAGKYETRFEATQALSAFSDPRALPFLVRGLTFPSPELRRACARALADQRDAAVPYLDRLADRKELSALAITELRRVFAGMQPIRTWKILGPFARDAQLPVDPAAAPDASARYPALADEPAAWRVVEAIDDQGQVDLNRLFAGDQRFALGSAEIVSPTARRAELAVGSDDTLAVWLNGKKVFEQLGDRAYAPAQDRLAVDLVAGANRLIVQCGNSGGGWQFGVAAEAPQEFAFLNAPVEGAFDPEAYRGYALGHPGDPTRGRKLFADLNGLACIKCHRVGREGGNVGPDLSAIGTTSIRDELISSVLYPSQKIFSGYEPVIVATNDGRVVTGILRGETPEWLEVQDAEARTIRLRKGEIDDRRTSDVSLMPSGLAEGLRPEDFADLIAYLVTLKQPASATR